MDTIASTVEVSLDLARELLIAISELNPDKHLSASNLLLDNLNKVSGAAFVSDIHENYRSKLISISYTQSPDVKTVPAAP